MNQPAAVVLNLAYTGLGIARSLSRHGVRVIGCTSQPRAFGKATRCAEVRHSPDSRNEPERLLAFLLQTRNELPRRTVVFPTRDDDVVFLDRYRAELSDHFVPAIPPPDGVRGALDKQNTYAWTQAAGVSSPRSWTVQSRGDIDRLLAELPFPCVLKPTEAYHWRREPVWQTVRHRKAIVAESAAQLLREYDAIAPLEPRALLQEFVSGGDQQLWIAACYVDRNSNVVASYAAHKLVQVPDGFGTGCVLQAVEHPTLIELAARVLKAARYQGLAEVEFKFEEGTGEYRLIEINPRPWDQHRLGAVAGVDLIYTAYCDYAGLPLPAAARTFRKGLKWVGEDVVLTTACQMLLDRDPRLGLFLRALAGRKTYGIWSISDPMPFVYFLTSTFLPQVVGGVSRAFRRRVQRPQHPVAARAGE
jgi:predicted ATP-grasp superfamily ATP-dependent carboligase